MNGTISNVKIERRRISLKLKEDLTGGEGREMMREQRVEKRERS